MGGLTPQMGETGDSILLACTRILCSVGICYMSFFNNT
jgi:hypothetical protein